MRAYELCLIFHPDTSEEGLDSILQSINEAIVRLKGTIIKTEKWGKKNFRFPIKKQTKGLYFFLCYEGNREIIKEIERLVRFNESILRYSTVLKSEEPVAEAPAAREVGNAAPESAGAISSEEHDAAQPDS